jgi:hypothetical protein
LFGLDHIFEIFPFLGKIQVCVVFRGCLGENMWVWEYVQWGFGGLIGIWHCCSALVSEKCVFSPVFGPKMKLLKNEV